MDVDYSNGSSSDSSQMNGSGSSEEVNVGAGVNFIEPYAYEPIETDSSGGGDDSGSEMASGSSSSENTRLQDTNW